MTCGRKHFTSKLQTVFDIQQVFIVGGYTRGFSFTSAPTFHWSCADGWSKGGVSLTFLHLPAEHWRLLSGVPGLSAHVADMRTPDSLPPILSASGISPFLPSLGSVCLKLQVNRKQLIRRKLKLCFNIVPAHSIQET